MIQLLEWSVESGDRGTKVKGSGQECPLHTGRGQVGIFRLRTPIRFALRRASLKMTMELW